MAKYTMFVLVAVFVCARDKEITSPQPATKKHKSEFEAVSGP